MGFPAYAGMMRRLWMPRVAPTHPVVRGAGIIPFPFRAGG